MRPLEAFELGEGGDCDVCAPEEGEEGVGIVGGKDAGTGVKSRFQLLLRHSQHLQLRRD
jgi:hypothetical protein